MDALRKENKALKNKLTESENKFKKLIVEIEELKKTQLTNAANKISEAENNNTSSSNCQETLDKILNIASSTATDLNDFKKQWVDVQTSVKDMKSLMGEFAQYTRINSLLFHGVKNVPSNIHGYEFA